MADFARFLSAFEVTTHVVPRPWVNEAHTGWTRLMGSHGGSTFELGLYRLHSEESSETAREDLQEGFPQLRNEIDLFGYDWLGRQFGVRRQVPRTVLMFEPGSGQVLDIPTSFAEFHDSELVDFRNDALAADFFATWSSRHRDAVPLPFDQCVGYRIPLFLGGADDLDNLEVTDLSVYLSLSAQMWAQLGVK
jgi:hypothetical protein